MDIETFKNYPIDSLFEKKFNFTREDDWKLPINIIDESWNIDSLADLKQNLNATKSLLNDQGEAWQSHTASINKAANVHNIIKNSIQPEILTQAWCKFYEILSSFSLIESSENIRTLHLCEAPGAFISALNYYLCIKHPSIQWKWIANTLNPYYEGHNMRTVVVDDRLLFPTLKNWFFSRTNTGDITDPDCMNHLIIAADEIGYFNLVTADGSVDCLDNPGEQESIVARLQFAEIIIALHTLLRGGSFVIKKFTFFECVTVCQMYILNCVFEKVHVFKPFTSKPSNSEVYVICTGFQGSEALRNVLKDVQHQFTTKTILPIFPESEIPKSFLNQLEECSQYFSNLQITAIQENIALFPLTDENLIQSLNELKNACAIRFVEIYSLYASTVYDNCKLISTKKKVVTSFYDKSDKDHKTVYFQAVGDTFSNIKKSKNVQWQDKLLNIENRLNSLFPSTKKRKKQEGEWCFPWKKEIGRKMKSKSFTNWITKGTKVTHIENSKFCYPALLYLWNQVSTDSNVDVNYYVAVHKYWPFDTLNDALSAGDSIDINKIFSLSPTKEFFKSDSLLNSLKSDWNFEVIHLNLDENHEVESMRENKIVYINSTVWIDSLHQECSILKPLTNGVHTALKILQKGDMLIICIQSILTRYSAGLLFIILSFFEKFMVLLPEDSKYMFPGQIWIFKNFLEQDWLNKTVEYMASINELNLEETRDVLEILPVSTLCGGFFHIHLREVNNKHLILRIRNLVETEKLKAVEKFMM